VDKPVHARGFGGLLSRMQEQRKSKPTTEPLPKIDRAGARRLIASAGPDVSRDGGHQWGGAARSWFIKTSSWHAIVVYGAVLAGVMTASLEGPQHAWSSGGLLESPPDSGAGGKEFNMMKKMSAVGVAAVMIASQTMAGDAVQWRVEDGGNGHWYALNSTGATWHNAANMAVARGGHLATVTSIGELAICQPIVATAWEHAWIGGFQADPSCGADCSWTWVTGEPWNYTNWAPTEPNNYWGIDSSEDYVAMYAWEVTGQWNDERESVNRPSLIEWSADCNNDGIVDYGQILTAQFDDLNGNNIPDCCEMGTPCVLPDACHVGETLLDDSFDAAEIDPQLWRIVLPSGCSTVAASAGQVTCRGRGHLQTASEFPVASSAVRVHSRFKFSDGLEIVAIQLLTDGAVTNGANYEACNNGLLVYFQPSAGDGVPIRVAGLGEISVGQPIARGAVQWQANEWFDLDIQVDDHTVKVSISKVSDPSVVAERLVPWAGTPRGFRVALFNREFCGAGGVSFTDVTISRPGVSGNDCDLNGIVDTCDLAAGAPDINHNNIPDTCECIGDIYVDGIINGGDLGVLLAYWGPTTNAAASIACDLNVDGVVNGSDLGILLAYWGPCSN
jgi:Lectin C-type domain